jgi:P-type conjugative transfer protein TrbJ
MVEAYRERKNKLRKIRRRLVASTLLLLWSVYSPNRAAAQWAVAEVTAPTQLLNQASAYTKQLEQIQNEITIINRQKDQISQLATTIKNQIQNLQRLPGSIQGDLLASGNKMTNLLSALGKVSGVASAATADFDALYGQIGQAGASGDMIQARLSMLKSRRAALGVGVQSSSIAKSVTDQFDKLRILLSNSFTAKGNLDAQQIAHQQQALQANILLQQQVMEAALARSIYEEKAEEVALAQARLKLMQQATAYIDTSKPYDSAGKLPDYERFYH